MSKCIQILQFKYVIFIVCQVYHTKAVKTADSIIKTTGEAGNFKA